MNVNDNTSSWYDELVASGELENFCQQFVELEDLARHFKDDFKVMDIEFCEYIDRNLQDLF